MAGSQFAKGSRAELAYAPEVRWGVAPDATTSAGVDDVGNINRLTLSLATHGYVAGNYVELIDGNSGTFDMSGFYRVISSTDGTFDVYVPCGLDYETDITTAGSAAYGANIDIGNTAATPTTALTDIVEAAASAYDVPLNGFTGESLKLNRNTIESDTMQSDQTTKYFSYGTRNVSGGIDTEMIFSDLDEMIESNMQSQWEPLTEITVDTAHAETIGSSGQSLTIAGTGGSFAGSFTVFLVTGATKLVIRHSDMPQASYLSGKDDTTGLSVDSFITDNTPYGLLIRNGTTQKPLTIETRFTDISQNLVKTGMVVNEITYSAALNTNATASLSFLGKTELPAATSTQVAQSLATEITKVVGTSPINTISGSFLENDTGISDVTGVDLTVNQNGENLETIFTDLSVGVNSNKYSFTGTLNMFLDDMVHYNKFINGTSSSLQFTIEEATGATIREPAYQYTLPSIRYTDSSAPAADQGTIAHSMPFVAIKDSTEGYAVQIVKIFSATA